MRQIHDRVRQIILALRIKIFQISLIIQIIGVDIVLRGKIKFGIQLIHHFRRGIIDKIKKSKDQGVSEDEIKVVEKEIEAITEKEIKSTEDLFVMKEKEIMSI